MDDDFCATEMLPEQHHPHNLILMFKHGTVHSLFSNNRGDQVDHMDLCEIVSSRPVSARFASWTVALVRADIVEFSISEYWSRNTESLTVGFSEMAEDGDEGTFLGWNQLPVKSMIHLSDQ